jgi:predicted nucleic acid-binding protein
LIRLVVDASVAVKWMVTEPDTADAMALLGAATLLAPELIVAECANILWKKARRENLDTDQALLAAELLDRWTLDLHPATGLAMAATRLALSLDHPAHDCFYVALALSENCPFVTADLRLARKLAAGSVAVPILSLAEAATLVGPQAP